MSLKIGRKVKGCLPDVRGNTSPPAGSPLHKADGTIDLPHWKGGTVSKTRASTGSEACTPAGRRPGGRSFQTCFLDFPDCRVSCEV